VVGIASRFPIASVSLPEAVEVPLPHFPPPVGGKWEANLGREARPRRIASRRIGGEDD
jgi:hypothetical protein